ncbi:MAG: hypothetical protein ACRCWL_05250 [Aeromonas sp.]
MVSHNTPFNGRKRARSRLPSLFEQQVHGWLGDVKDYARRR